MSAPNSANLAGEAANLGSGIACRNFPLAKKQSFIENESRLRYATPMPALMQKPGKPPRAGVAPDGAAAFTEAPAWLPVGKGWQPLFGSFQGLGYSIEWHEFDARSEFDWGASFHPGGVELCLNLAGHGYVEMAGVRQDLAPTTAGFYRRVAAPLRGRRHAGQRHEFLTAEFSDEFLARQFAGAEAKLHPLVRAAIEKKSAPSGPATPTHITADQQQLVATLRRPPVFAAAQPIWFQCKAIELAATFFFRPPPEEEFFCTRQHRLAQERVEQVIYLLRQKLAEPFSLEELGRKIGCSPFYLTRTFSQQTGRTISQHLRLLRMEKAAELLRQRELNVTEVALDVGYSSPSHFSQAFRETFGCCPGLYPIQTIPRLPLR
jgi:AraC-like DNA-binding protein